MHVMRAAALRLALALSLLAAPLPAVGEEPFTPEVSVTVIRNYGFFLGLVGGPLKRCDPAYDTAITRGAVEALGGRVDWWGHFDRARRLGLSEVEPKLASTPPEKIDCEHYRIGAKTFLATFLEHAPRLR